MENCIAPQMPQPSKPSRRFSFFGLGSASSASVGGGAKLDPPQLKLESDRDVYRPGDLITITIEIKNPVNGFSLLIEKLSFEFKGIEKLDSQWFSTPKPSPDPKQRRGEYLFMDCSTPSIVSNQILSSRATKTYVVRTLLPNNIPPSYRGTTIRYLYYVRTTLSGQYLSLENGLSHGGSVHDFSELEARIPLQIWITQKNNGQLGEEGRSDGIVPQTTILLDAYWKTMDADSEWAKVHEALDGVEEGYESSQDDISSVSSYNHMNEDIHRTFGSSSSLQSFAARSSSTRGSLYVEGRTSISSNMALPRLPVAELLHDLDGSPGVVTPRQPPKHLKALSTEDDSRFLSASGSIESGASEGVIRGRSYNIRLDDQVLLRFSPKNSDSNYYFSDMIGGTLSFFHGEGARRCLELSITLEAKESVNKRFVHPSRRHSLTITKDTGLIFSCIIEKFFRNQMMVALQVHIKGVENGFVFSKREQDGASIYNIHNDHHEVVADLVQTSFLFSIPMDGPMTFSTRYISVQWALRFEFLTTPKNVDWTRFEHPLLIEGRDKCEWVLPITVHAPPLGAAAAQTRNQKLFSSEPLWIRT